MSIIGLTGPTGAGKSSLTKVAQDLGYKVIDCDKTARKATERGSDGLVAVARVFGNDILNPDGTLNRASLAKKAFATRQGTELLNKTLLPFIAELVLAECNGQRVLLDAPTLIESGLDQKCDAVIAVWADEEERLKRIMARDSINRSDAMLRMKAGNPLSFYKERADYLIYNNGNANVFEMKFAEIINRIKER